jgi:hemoglobin-like flavoprotein
VFYELLFEMEPELRRLFGRTDMQQQRQKLMQTLAVAVGALDRLETLRPALEALGRLTSDRKSGRRKTTGLISSTSLNS